MQDKSFILDFFEKAALYEKLTTMSYEKKTSSKKYPFDYISLENITLKEHSVDITINKQMELFLLNDTGTKKGISPCSYINNKNLSKGEIHDLKEFVEQELFESGLKEGSQDWEKKKLELEIKNELKIDRNKLVFAPIYIKVNFIEEDVTVFVPFAFFFIDKKEEIKHHAYTKENPYILSVDSSETELVYNDFVISMFLNESFKDIQSSLFYISNADTLTTTEELFERIYSNIKGHLKTTSNEIFDITIPDLKTDPIGLFFNVEDNLETLETFSNLKKSESELLEKYLLDETTENHSYSLTDDIYYGSFTRDFSLGEGQAIVLGKNQKDEVLTSVIGAPGTGKTTLFLSIVANNVTKRAMSLIYNKKDYNNLMLITSTSNKAVENVYKELKENFSSGFCYIGGNYENRKASAAELYQIIHNLKELEYREGSLEEAENEIKRIVSYFRESKEKYLSTRKVMKDKFGITSLEHLKGFKLESLDMKTYKEDMEWIESANEIKDSLNRLINQNYSLEFYIDYLKSADYLKIMKSAEKIVDINIVFEVLGFAKIIAKQTKLEVKSFETKDPTVLIHIAEYLKSLKNYSKEVSKALSFIKDYEEKKELSKIDMKLVKKVLEYKSFGDYFRKELYKENYQLFLVSKRYLELIALQKKYSLIDSLEFLASGDMYSVKNPKEFLENITLLYPVVTSTLAGFKYMFRNLNTDIIYETVLSDESGMIKVQDLLHPFNKAKRAIVVGDPKQLQPIVTMHDLFAKYLKEKTKNKEIFYTYSPTEVSGFHRAAATKEGGYKQTGKGIVLDEHRRCQKQIADLFIKVAEYQGLKVKTPQKAFIEPFESNLLFFNVINREKKDRHINEREVEAIEKVISMLDNHGLDIKSDVCIITPYYKQEERLIEKIGSKIGHSKENRKIGTVHKFQGVEFKVVIFSTVVSSEDDSLKFINKDPSMVNVAISRAKDLFIVVGDKDKITGTEQGNYIGRMADLMKNYVMSIDDIFFH